MATAIPRLTLAERVQHGVLALAVCGALATGLVSGVGGAGSRSWHVAAGFVVLAVLVVHALSLVVQAYVESRGWGGLPLALTGDDWRAAAGEVRHLFGSAPERPEGGEYRFSQKLFYWWSVCATLALGATGVGMDQWERFGTLPSLPALSALHRGVALVLLASALWHLYGALVWEGRWWPEMSWLTGELDAEKALRKVPGAHRRHLEEEALAAGEGDASPEERERKRQETERSEVETELERGNSCALEERFVEALHHYRRALELYPGYSQAMYNMARVLSRMGEYDMAVETYTQFLAADPFHPLARKAQEAVRELAERREGRP